MDKEEREFNDPKGRLKEHSYIRIYEDKRIQEIQNELRIIKALQVKLIKMLTAHDYDCKKRSR